jgi:hypothetical protein
MDFTIGVFTAFENEKYTIPPPWQRMNQEKQHRAKIDETEDPADDGFKVEDFHDLTPVPASFSPQTPSMQIR